MPMVNGPGDESILIRQIARTWAFEYLNIGSYIHYEVIMCLETNLLQRICLVIHYIERYGM
jgi:hypothetical protein